METSKRELYIDYTRAIAIIVATIFHICGAFGILTTLERLGTPTYSIIRIFASLPTPTLIIIFGIMLEIVYLKYQKEFGYKQLFKRTLQRAFYIYICYALTTISFYILYKFHT